MPSSRCLVLPHSRRCSHGSSSRTAPLWSHAGARTRCIRLLGHIYGDACNIHGLFKLRHLDKKKMKYIRRKNIWFLNAEFSLIFKTLQIIIQRALWCLQGAHKQLELHYHIYAENTICFPVFLLLRTLIEHTNYFSHKKACPLGLCTLVGSLVIKDLP